MHSSIVVANQLIKLAESQGKSLTPMQLIKLVYLCHAWMLGLYGKHLIKDPIEAWLYGPVIKTLYDKIKQHRSSPVYKIMPSNDDKKFDPLEEDLINQIFETYGNFTGIELSTLTHEEGSPWSITWNNDGKNAHISNDLIENYYKRMAKQNEPQSSCDE